MGNFLTFIGLLAAAAFAAYSLFSSAHADDEAYQAIYGGFGVTALGAAVYLGYALFKGSQALRASRLWDRLRKLPKPRRNTLGIAIVATAETEEQMPQLTHDFIDNLKGRSQEGRLANLVSVVPLPPTSLPKNPTAEDMRRLLMKTRCVLLITVYARVRRVKGAEHHVLDLEGAVKHGAVEGRVQAVFVKEMKELLAHRRHISRSNDLEEFEWNAASVHLAVLYILAAAAILSGRPDVSLFLLDELRAGLAAVGADQPPTVRRTVQELRRRLPINKAIAHLHASQVLHLRWRQTRDLALMEGIAEHLTISDRLLPHMPEVWNGWALYHVVKNRDMGAARKELKKFRAARIKSPLWRFNLGFTYAYEGNMVQASALYSAACKMKPHPAQLLEVEEFIEWMLREEPGKSQLRYILGLISQFGKKDPEGAARHYRAFLSETAHGQFQEQREQAQRYLEEPAVG